MNILFIGSTDIRGGAGRVSTDLMEGLRAKGHDVKQIVAYKYSQNSQVHQLSTFPTRNSALMGRHLRSFILANDIDYGLDEEILSHPWYKKADVVSLHNRHGNFLSLSGLQQIAKEKKVFWTLHDMWSITSHCAYTNHPNSDIHDPFDCRCLSYPPQMWNNQKRVYEQKMNILKKSNITYISPSLWLKERFLQSPLKKKTIEYIRNGIDAIVFSPGNQIIARKNRDLDPQKKYALFLAEGGEKNYRKGIKFVRHLINAQPIKNNGIEFIIVGGHTNKTIDNVTYVQRTSSKAVLAEYYRSANVYLFPSLADNCPLTVLESLSVGTPVLGFDTCGVGELITHKKTGYIAKFQDYDDFENGFMYILDKVNLKNTVQKNTFGKVAMVSAYEKVFGRG